MGLFTCFWDVLLRWIVAPRRTSSMMARQNTILLIDVTNVTTRVVNLIRAIQAIFIGIH